MDHNTAFPPLIRLAKEFEPVPVPRENLYRCPFETCDFGAGQKIDTVAAHLRRHLSLSIACHYCTKLFQGSEGWLKKTPAEPTKEGGYLEQAPKEQDLLKETVDACGIAKQEEAQAIKNP